MEPEICTKMLRNLSEKFRAKFPSIAHGYPMAKFARLDDAYSEVSERKASPVEGQSLHENDKKRRKRKGKKKKKTKSLKMQEANGLTTLKAWTKKKIVF